MQSYQLPPLTLEQQNILNYYQNYNIIVDAVAGSGKTTTNLYIAQSNKNHNILLLTYNSRLKIETRKKVQQLQLSNLQVHSYHSFCVTYYDKQAYQDNRIYYIIDNDIQMQQQQKYDTIIIDEVQDMSELYYKLFLKIFKDNNNNNCKICILGDVYQSIFQFNQADQRYLQYADQLFNINNFEFKKCQLSESFRITQQMATFINKCVLQQDRLVSYKQSNNKVQYYIIDIYQHRYIYKIIQQYKQQGYSYNDIFILAPSVKSQNTPVRRLANYLSEIGIFIYVPFNDEEKIDDDILKNKLLIATYHQVKGLERKIVLVYNFDQSYQTFYNKKDDLNKCPNTIYVALTRAQEHLVLLHSHQQKCLQFLKKEYFLNRDIIKDYCEIHNNIFLQFQKQEEKQYYNQSVTELLRNLPQYIITKCLQFIQQKQIRQINQKINIKVKQLFNHNKMKIYENVSDINGIAIPQYFQYILFNQLEIFEQLLQSKSLYTYQVQQILQTKNNKLPNNISIQQILELSNLFISYSSGYNYKINQINTYEWLKQQQLDQCLDRLKSILQIDKQIQFEYKCQVKDKIELDNRQIIGYIDCINDINVYEFKCVDQLTEIHILQLSIYMYQMFNEKKKYQNYNYYLYNILTDELIQIISTSDNLSNMMQYLINEKFNNNTFIEDQQFIEKNIQIQQSMLQ